MPAIDFRKLKGMVSMAEVLTLLRFIPLSRSGAQVRGPCPIHAKPESEKGRSFSANLLRNTFQCFQCGVAGNHIDLWAKATQQTIYEAALDLCNRLNREVPWRIGGSEKRNQ